MKGTFCALALVSVSAFIASCVAPASNTTVSNANTNSNSISNVKPAGAAPTKEALMDIDKKANEAYMKGDSQFFQDALSDKFVMFEGGHRITKADSVKMIAGVKCDVKDIKFDDPQMSMIDPDTYVMSYKMTADGTCNDGPAGASVKIPSPVRSSTVYVRQGDKWMAAFHGKNAIIDPKNMPPAPPAGDKKAPANGGKMAANTNSNTNSASNMGSAPAASSGDANTDALVKLHTAGWEAFKAKDAKKFEDMMTQNASFEDGLGNWYSGRSATVSHWTSEMKCEGVNNVKVSDGVASALSPTVEVLTLKGNADGTCDGMKNGDLYQTAFYVKEGDAWKLAFMFESIPH